MRRSPFILILLLFFLPTKAQVGDINPNELVSLTTSNLSQLEQIEELDINSILGTSFLSVDLVQVSPDGRYIGLYLVNYTPFASPENRLIIIDVYTRDLIAEWTMNVEQFALSRNAQWIAFTNEREEGVNQLTLVDVYNFTNDIVFNLEITDFELSQDNRFLTFSSFDEESNRTTISIWSLDSHTYYSQIALLGDPSVFSGPVNLATSPDVENLAFANADSLILYDISDMSNIFQLELPLEEGLVVMDLLFSLNSKKLLLSTSSGATYIVDIESQDVQQAIEDHRTLALQIRNSSPRNIFGIATTSGMSFVDLTTTEIFSTVNAAFVLDTSIDSEFALAQESFGDYRHLQIFSIQSGDVLFDIIQPEMYVRDVFISPALNYIAIVTESGFINIYGIQQ